MSPKLSLPVGIWALNWLVHPSPHPKRHLDWITVLAQLMVVTNKHIDDTSVAIGCDYELHACDAA